MYEIKSNIFLFREYYEATFYALDFMNLLSYLQIKKQLGGEMNEQ